MSGKRPYGISLKGVDSTRILKKKTGNESKKVERQSNCIAKYPGQEAMNFMISESIHGSTANKGQKKLEQIEKIQSELKFVEKFLSFAYETEESNQKQTVQFEDNLIKQVKLKDNLIKILTEVLKKKKKWICHCGKEYTSEEKQLLHIKKSHQNRQRQNQIQNEEQKLPLCPFRRRRKIRVEINWGCRVYATSHYLQATFIENYALNQNEFQILIRGRSKVYLKQFFNCQNQKICKKSCLIFTQQLSRFINSDMVLSRVWENNFEEMANLSNIFYGWLISNNRVKDYCRPDISVEFYLQMYTIFSQWCFYLGYCTSFVTKNKDFETK